MKKERRRQQQTGGRRRGVVAVQVAVLSTVLVGFAALTVDVGVMYNSKADMQRTADASALAAASQLAEFGGEIDALTLARRAAMKYATLNPVLGTDMQLDYDADIAFGRATLNGATGQYDFEVTEVLPDAVRVRVRRTADSANGSVQLYFARIFGINDTEMSAEAIAVMVPRDMAIVADLSGSHNDDSELKNYRETDINLFEVWEGLPIPTGRNGVGDGVTGPPPGDPANPAPAPGTGPGSPGSGGFSGDPGTNPTGGQVGPTWGWLYYWGNTIDPGYDPVTDPGLMHFPRRQAWNNADLATWYTAVGYSDREIDALLSDDYDGSYDSNGQDAWTNRVAIALGLARWDSGMPGGLWESIPRSERNEGNGNGWMGSSELMWLVDYPFDAGSWQDYIYNYVRRSSTRMARANRDFRYRFGVKTFANYLLERRLSNSSTPELADTPSQPMQAVKDAVTYLTSFVDAMDTDDQLSLEIYGTTARHEVDLTTAYAEVSDRLATMQAGYYDSWTNMGGGIERAIEELSSDRARGTSHKMIILLTDGYANVNASGGVGDLSGGVAYSLAMAEAAADAGIRIFAVSVGADSNQVLMDQVADIGQGEHLHAEGSIEEYSAQLANIFRRLGGERPVELIR